MIFRAKDDTMYIVWKKKDKEGDAYAKETEGKDKAVKNKCPEKLIRTEAAKEIAEIDRSLQDQKYQLRCRAAIDLLTAKLNMINADLSRKKRHVVINQISSRVKTAESIYTKTDPVKAWSRTFDTAVNTWDYSAKRVTDSVYESMERLNIDYIDLINVHDVEFADLNQVVNETLPALVKLRDGRSGEACGHHRPAARKP